MDPDLLLVTGIIFGALSVPSLLSAYAESRPPRFGAIMVLIGGLLIAGAMLSKVGGYAIAEIPQVFMNVIDRYIR